MAVPTIVSVTPTTGHSGGRTLVEVVGTGFALPPPPPPTGVAPSPPPSLAVTFGGAPAVEVHVASPTLAYVLTPDGDPDGGAVAVAVQNCDATGAPVAGETAALPAAYTFARPDLSVESDLAAVVRALLRTLKRQVLSNVVFTTHTDYDDATGDQLNYAAVQKLPALILANLDVPEDRAAANAEEEDVDAPGARFVTRRAPIVVAVRFTLVGVSDNPVELLNLMQAVRNFFRKTPRLRVPRDPSDPSLGAVDYPMGFAIAGGVGVTAAGDNSNVQSFAGSVVVEEVRLEDIPGLPRAAPPGAPPAPPHEATTSFGWKTADDRTAVTLAVEPKAP